MEQWKSIKFGTPKNAPLSKMFIAIGGGGGGDVRPLLPPSLSHCRLESLTEGKIKFYANFYPINNCVTCGNKKVFC